MRHAIFALLALCSCSFDYVPGSWDGPADGSGGVAAVADKPVTTAERPAPLNPAGGSDGASMTAPSGLAEVHSGSGGALIRGAGGSVGGRLSAAGGFGGATFVTAGGSGGAAEIPSSPSGGRASQLPLAGSGGALGVGGRNSATRGAGGRIAAGGSSSGGSGSGGAAPLPACRPDYTRQPTGFPEGSVCVSTAGYLDTSSITGFGAVCPSGICSGSYTDPDGNTRPMGLALCDEQWNCQTTAFGVPYRYGYDPRKTQCNKDRVGGTGICL